MDPENAVVENLTNIQIVQQLYTALGKGDIPTVLSLLAEDVVWEMPHPRDQVPFGGIWKGVEEVKQFFMTTHDCAQFKQVQIQEYIAQEDKVVVIGHNKVMAKPTGKEYENDFVAVWTVQYGKIKEMRDFMDTVQAVTAFQTDA
ncbi:MAG: nuclear transport factor 2 family protein [Microcystis aeruginosa BS13-02]|jgi:ketosteroid isomerase-like protein|uniref:nuclear transport factor 2 family protein n=1 Tax=Microcystis sp. BLCC-F210 TaxID=3342751 RepID=UPI00119723AC|nr:nuclear transport factor 2 family protein [Snowella sp.]NCS26938.1 nuclear transport factor 2 family protein [Microcystis aeruginosa BS13-02]TRU21694.1 MAG: nuclear transport factor 2 family protein [Microcystis aeruginosa Ma_MB_S_20031200_S102D]